MSDPEDIRKTVSKSYTRAVEQNEAPGNSCCSGPAPESALATLNELAGKVTSIRVVGRKPEEVLL